MFFSRHYQVSIIQGNKVPALPQAVHTLTPGCPDTQPWKYRHSALEVQTLTLGSTDTHPWKYRHSPLEVQTLSPGSTDTHP